MQGFLEFITGNSAEAQNLRKNIIFKVIPMMNPDGVIIGNSRTSFSGRDLNRTFLKPDNRLHPIPFHIKKLVENLTRNNRVVAYIDIHGHSKKKGSFMYGPHFPLHDERYFRIRMIPKLMSVLTPVFRYYSCKFRYEKYKMTAARIVIAKEYGVTCCFTLENSMFAYLDENRNTIVF